MARKFKLPTLALLLDAPEGAARAAKAKPYLDALLADVARENKIETIGLESMIEQIEVLNGLPHEIERDLLVAILCQVDHDEEIANATVAPYIEGNIGDLLTWMRSAARCYGGANSAGLYRPAD